MTVTILDVENLEKSPEAGRFRDNPPDICFLSEGGHCGVWWKASFYRQQKLGVIGHFSAENGEQCRKLLEAACGFLHRQGCDTAIGPMDGSTWKPYRFVTWTDGSPPFLMEPQNPLEWPEYWKQYGFSPCHEYISTSVVNTESPDPRIARARKRLNELGIAWRPVDLSRFEEELQQVYVLSLEAFKDNVLYSEIDQQTFMKQYLPFSDKIDREYVLLAHDRDAGCCGFIFAVPDLLQLQQGAAIDRLIIKTLAVKSGRRSGGLGAVLVDEVQKKAKENGLHSSIHALMYSGNVSANIGKGSTLLRRYTLFERRLS